MRIPEGFKHDFLPSGVKKTMDEMKNPRMSPTTNTQAMTEPNRHQLITMATPPTTPISAVRANRTAETVNKLFKDTTGEQGKKYNR